MANEIKISASLNFLKAGIGSSLSETDLSFDVAGSDYTQMSLSVGTGETALDFGSITTPGYIFIKNTDTTNYVELRAATTIADTVRINAGEVALFRLAADATAPKLTANAAACIVNYLLIED